MRSSETEQTLRQLTAVRVGKTATVGTRRRAVPLAALLLTICIAGGSAIGQERDHGPGGPGGGGGPGSGPGGGGMGMDDGPGRPDAGQHGPNFGGEGHRGPQRPQPDLAKYEMLRSYIDTVDHMSKLAADPTAAGVAAVVSASDLLRQNGPTSAIDYFTKILPDVKNPSVARAIRIQLIDLYKQSNNSQKALEQMDELIKGAAQGISAP